MLNTTCGCTVFVYEYIHALVLYWIVYRLLCIFLLYLFVEQPLEQLPVYTCEDGEMVMSNSIARYVAKKFGKKN